ncbi:hypothetical protein [Plantactinospora sp. B5E13]|uniref:hypothetical protein n=1 Tax=unclassified Plantactinospora TaxID=2631981 RepID=UPI00325EA7B6
MPERPAARDDATDVHQPPPEPSREPRVNSPDTRDVDRADGADDHENHDPYQPL